MLAVGTIAGAAALTVVTVVTWLAAGAGDADTAVAVRLTYALAPAAAAAAANAKRSAMVLVERVAGTPMLLRQVRPARGSLWGEVMCPQRLSAPLRLPARHSRCMSPQRWWPQRRNLVQPSVSSPHQLPLAARRRGCHRGDRATRV